MHVPLQRWGWVVVFVASYFSSTDVSMGFFAAGDYDREMRDVMIQPNSTYMHVPLQQCTGNARRWAAATGTNVHDARPWAHRRRGTYLYV
jgi:hypothetical protein